MKLGVHFIFFYLFKFYNQLKMRNCTVLMLSVGCSRFATRRPVRSTFAVLATAFSFANRRRSASPALVPTANVSSICRRLRSLHPYRRCPVWRGSFAFTAEIPSWSVTNFIYFPTNYLNGWFVWIKGEVVGYWILTQKYSKSSRATLIVS